MHLYAQRSLVDNVLLFFPQVIEEPYLKILYTAEERYTLKKSDYSNYVSTSNTVLRPSRFLTISLDADEKCQLEQQIKVLYLHFQNRKTYLLSMILMGYFGHTTPLPKIISPTFKGTITVLLITDPLAGRGTAACWISW